MHIIIFSIISYLIVFSITAMGDKQNNQPIINVSSYTTQQYSPKNQGNVVARFARQESLRAQAPHLTPLELHKLIQESYAVQLQKNRINVDVISNLSFLGVNLQNEPLQQLLSLKSFNEPILPKQAIKVLDKIIVILYTPDGYPNLQLNIHQKSHIARIITDELKIQNPKGFLNVISALSLKNIEFKEIVLQETKLFPWVKFKIVGWTGGLVKGVLCAFHGNINIDQLKENILANSFNRNLIVIKESFLKGNVGTAKSIVDSYKNNQSSEFYVGLYATTQDLYDTYLEGRAKVIEPDNCALAQSYIRSSVVARRLVPLATNLKDEIKRNIAMGAPKEQLQKLQEQLIHLDAYARQVCNNYSSDVHRELVDFVFQVENELGVYWRPELKRSPSAEKLFAQQTDFLVSSKDVGTISLADLRKFSGTAEQNALNTKMVDHFSKIDSLHEKLNTPVALHAVETYKELLARAHELNKDSCVTLAEGVFTVAKDMVEIAIFDPPMKEIEDYLLKTVTHPTDYVIKTIEGYKCVASVVLDACKHALPGTPTTPEQRLEFAEYYNKAIHTFFEGWQKLETTQKKEFLAQIIVDTALNKVVFSLPKLLLKLGGSSVIGDVLQKGESIFNKIDPRSSGGAVAVASPAVLSEKMVGALEYAAEVVSSTPGIAVIAGGQDVVTLSEVMNSSGGDNLSKYIQGNQYELPPEKLKAYTIVVEDGVSKIVETTFSTEEALEILNNSDELKVLNSRVEELKKVTLDTKFGVSHKRLEHSLKLFEKAIGESEQFYEAMRQSSEDIEKIYNHSGIPKNILQKIKNHVFVEEHILSALKSEKFIDKFAADIDIADAWKRLIDGNFVQSDLILLQHELSEATILKGVKIDYDTIHHNVIQKIYNWSNCLS